MRQPLRRAALSGRTLVDDSNKSDMIFGHDLMSKIRCRFPRPAPMQGAFVARGRIVSLPDVVGLVGVLAYLHAYAMAQLQILAITD